MSYDDIGNANLEQPEKSEVAHFVWQYFAVTRLLQECACFVTKVSVDAAPPEHIS